MSRAPQKRRLRGEWGWILGIAALIVLGLWWFPNVGTGEENTFSVDPRGKKAFYLIMDKHFDLRRDVEDLIPRHKDVKTLLILGPARYPTRTEWRALEAWVKRGNTLVFAARAGNPKVDASPLPFKIEGGKSGRGLDKLRVLFKGRLPETGLITGLAEGKFYWSGNGYLELEDGRGTMLVSQKSKVRAAKYYVGRGRVIAIASDDVFSNRPIVHYPDNGLLGMRLVEQGHMKGRVQFDESLNATGTPKVVGLIFDPTFRPFTLQIIFIALLFGWSGFRRFGPTAPPPAPPRRAIAEHAVALGNLHFKARNASAAVGAYLDYLYRETNLARVAHSRAEQAVWLARRAHLEPAEVAELLERAHRAAQDETLTMHGAANIVRSLAWLKRRGERHRAGGES